MGILSLLFRLRWAVLGLSILVAAAGGYAGLRDVVPTRGMLLAGAASLLLSAGVGFLHLRHAGLALIAALAPVLGLIAASVLARGLTVPELLAIYGVGAVAAGLVGGEIVRRVLVENSENAAMLALARMVLPVLLAVLAGAAILAAWLFRGEPGHALHVAGTLVASGVFGISMTTFGASVLPFSEAFFTIANRVRERRERVLRIATQIVVPRWGLSVAGIALVLAVLGWFGAAPFIAHGALIARPSFWGISAFGAFLLVLGIGRDWREALAATLALAVLVLLALWAWGVGAARFSPAIPIAIVAAAAYLPMLALIAGRRRFAAAGDESALARLRALEELGLSPGFVSASAAAAILPWAALHGAAVVLAGSFLLAGVAAIIMQPAIATALAWFIPRRRSLNELYGRG